MASGSRVWSMFSLAAALAGAALARKALTTSWRAATGKNPPANPADPDVQMSEALAWAAFSGTFIAIARMLATRKAADYYIRSTGKIPADLNREDVPAEDAPPIKT